MSSSVGRLSQLDGATLMKLQAGCNFINAQVEKRRGRVIVVTIVAMIGCFVVMRTVFPDPRVFIAGGMLALLFFGYEQQQLAKSYKSIVVRRVVAALGNGLTYSPESSFTKDAFLTMDLFLKRCEKLESEDEVCGRKNLVSYSIHEATATRTEGSGKNRRTVTIFRGLIVRLDFNKHFHGHTVVVPDAESQILGGLFGESESRRSKEIVRLENADFENVYSVYGTDDQQARYLLTPKVMELVLQARSQLGADIRLAFLANSLYVTIPQSKNRFEVSMFGGKVTPESSVGDLVEVVSLAERLVDVLDLETRIWSRV